MRSRTRLAAGFPVLSHLKRKPDFFALAADSNHKTDAHSKLRNASIVHEKNGRPILATFLVL
jgi:hypothetical protein